MKTKVHKLNIRLHADPKRVIALPFPSPGPERAIRICKHIERMNADEAGLLMENVRNQFGHRHKNIESIFRKNFKLIDAYYPDSSALPDLKRLLIGAMHTKEYSIQSAALFNPSMVPHTDQSGLKEGQKRFVISLRSTGEGHMSSISFRSGIVDDEGNLFLDDASKYALTGEVSEMNNVSYRLRFPEDSLLSERVLFPQTRQEMVGMEDVRLVLFEEGEEKVYYGTYTAYDGSVITSKMLRTTDFLNFQVFVLSGNAVRDKGMAVFPEKINGKYAIVSRQGGESISIMFSQDLLHWSEFQSLMEPRFEFEISQMGNCGSPIKTDRGWLLLTHGVGPMRQYTISAALLDTNDPSKVISRMNRPLIQADEDEREGYVPNVVYSCGGMLHGDILYIPYAMSDSTTGFAWLKLNDLLVELEEVK